MNRNPTSAAIAAFDICESLLLALVELKILTTPQVVVVLQDVAEVHKNVLPMDGDLDLHRETVLQVERLIKSQAAFSQR